MRRGQALWITLAVLSVVVTTPAALHAAPYASGVTVTGTTVNFILNEPADALTYSINGGAALTLDGTTKGAKTFMLGSPTDTFSIFAEKNDAVGYTIPNGETIDYSTVANPALKTHGLFDPSPEAGLNIISDESSLLLRFNSPRGIDVSRDANSPNFGTTYVANAIAGTQTASGRVLGDGLYALRADGSDAFAYGDTAQNPIVDGFPAFVTNDNSPFRITVADDGLVYVADWSDANGQLFQFQPNIASGINAFPVFGGPSTLPTGQTHGSIASVYVEGSLASGDLTAYTIDEDMTTASLTGSGSTTNKNSVWRYDIGSGPLPSSVVPTLMSSALIPAAPVPDITRGADGKWYLTQYRAQASNSRSLIVLSPDMSTVLYDSLADTRTIKGDPAFANDILQYIRGVAVSDDQQWLALQLSGSDVAVIPLDAGGLPELENRMVVQTAADVALENLGRDIAFDAAGNIHYVSSGQGRYRVLSPGGHTLATTSFDGTDFDFAITTVGGADDADFDGDGDVDGADFLTWQRGLGATGAPSEQGDANGDGDIDGDDLAIWRDQFGPGAATPAAGAVPEPSTWALAALGALACLAVAAPQRRAALARVKATR